MPCPWIVMDVPGIAGSTATVFPCVMTTGSGAGAVSPAGSSGAAAGPCGASVRWQAASTRQKPVITRSLCVFISIASNGIPRNSEPESLFVAWQHALHVEDDTAGPEHGLHVQRGLRPHELPVGHGQQDRIITPRRRGSLQLHPV